MTIPQANLQMAWLWIVLGLVSGFLLGLHFHRDDWLGGYGSFKRRLYRLAHISFFGLAILNLLFYVTVRELPRTGPNFGLAGWGFILGALTMPMACVVMANYRQLRALFLIPVTCLFGGATLTLLEVFKL